MWSIHYMLESMQTCGRTSTQELAKYRWTTINIPNSKSGNVFEVTMKTVTVVKATADNGQFHNKSPVQ